MEIKTEEKLQSAPSVQNQNFQFFLLKMFLTLHYS